MTEAQEAYSRYYRLEGPKDRDTKDLAVSDAELALEEAEDALQVAVETHNSTVYASEDEEQKAKDNIANAIHQYIVNTAISDWFAITNKDDAAIYTALAESNIENLQQTMYKRMRPKKP
jgi:hypothetical protein